MTKRMLIDSTHAEETRVVLLDGNRLEDFDLETSTKQQLKGNIYLAKVVRVEPSLQAAFVEYGGNRHGFLAFSEIHPDYYQIPVADRKRLLEAQIAEAREAEEEEDYHAEAGRAGSDAEADTPYETFSDSTDLEPGDAREARPEPADLAAGLEPEGEPATSEAVAAIIDVETAPEPNPDPALDEPASFEARSHEPDLAQPPAEPVTETPVPPPEQVAMPAAIAQDILVAPEEAASLFPAEDEAVTPRMDADEAGADMAPEAAETGAGMAAELPEPGADMAPEQPESAGADMAPEAPEPAGMGDQPELPSRFGRVSPEPDFDALPPEPPPEQIGGELDVEEHTERRAPPRFLRHYKIQEVIRRRQIMLVQVVKEERGTKGAALTTYISLAGRFSVLMPNSPRGGGISRKITSPADRRRLKEVTAELKLPSGMGLIVRTAGANRPKPEILRDCEYLLGQWDQIRELTMKSVAPALIYEEASLIKRAIRDLYSRDVDEILVDGEQGWRAARDFMRMLMPTHARKVQLWRDPQPLFGKMQVDSQLDAMLTPTVQLKSGGYLVINQTEALVAIDVNSGRSTRERGIEETALRTNVEAAEEVARQLRLRDLAGLIVIDFIDMENRRNVATVERRLKDALRYDRARIQVGSISHFGLLEMSRQRLRPSLAETNFIACPHCGGTGHVRSTESAALHVLRQIEEEGGKRRAAEIVVHCDGRIALYILNHKRMRLAEIEARHGLHVTFGADESLTGAAVRIERIRAQVPSELPRPVQQIAPVEPFEDFEDTEPEAEPEVETEEAEDAEDAEFVEAAAPESAEERDRKRGRRRRRRRGPREDAVAAPETQGDAQPEEALEAEPAAPVEDEAAEPLAAESGEGGESEEGERRRRRRGGRRRRREFGDRERQPEAAEPGAEPAESEEPEPGPIPVPIYAGPTPANPFGGPNAFDFFDAIELAEQEQAAAPRQLDAAPQGTPEPEPAPEPALERAPEAAPEPQPEPAHLSPEPTAPEPEPEPVTATDLPPLVPEPESLPVADPIPTDHAPTLPPLNALPAAEPEPPPPAPAILPVLVGAEAAPAEKKRGWWRR